MICERERDAKGRERDAKGRERDAKEREKTRNVGATLDGRPNPNDRPDAHIVFVVLMFIALGI
ncbi:MAG: hypothetical protein N2559_03250, partial [Anaerolineae bacterium]|nr:hypothetical protein [Anaerolineae bacterium]